MLEVIQTEQYPDSNKINFNTPYIGQLQARTDWVAGGNFDGYIMADVITFLKETNEIVWEQKAVAHFYDGRLPETKLIQRETYDFSDKRAICFMGYRGRFLGDKNEYLILDAGNSGEVLCFVADVKKGFW